MGRKVLAAMLAVLLIQGPGGNFINGWEKRNVQAAEESKMTQDSSLQAADTASIGTGTSATEPAVSASKDSAGGLSGAEPTEPAAEAAASTASEPHAGPSAPASSTAFAVSVISVTFGVSFTIKGLSKTFRQLLVTFLTPSYVVPKAKHPCFTFGQDKFSSTASISNEFNTLQSST